MGNYFRDREDEPSEHACSGDVIQRHADSGRLHEILHELGALHDVKQADYGTIDDPFANVRGAARDWGIPSWQVAMVRASDKMHRLQTYARRGTLANEGVKDSFNDLALYTVIARVLFELDTPKLTDVDYVPSVIKAVIKGWSCGVRGCPGHDQAFVRCVGSL